MSLVQRVVVLQTPAIISQLDTPGSRADSGSLRHDESQMQSSVQIPPPPDHMNRKTINVLYPNASTPTPNPMYRKDPIHIMQPNSTTPAFPYRLDVEVTGQNNCLQGKEVRM
jgi:hypothetical protein